jgi:hypothetical protein
MFDMFIEGDNRGESQIMRLTVAMATIALMHCAVIHICKVGVAFGTFEMLLVNMFDVRSSCIVTQPTQSTGVQVTVAFRFYMLSE